jgi:uncharacterized membrane protein YkvA (DUF1232 family)
VNQVADRSGATYRGTVPKLRRTAAFLALWRAFRPPGLRQRLTALPRMIKATLLGRYDGGKRLLLMAAAAVYIVSPIDLLPEAIFAFVGLIDDAVVFAWLVGALVSELDRFVEWERSRGVVITGEVTHQEQA